jgi:imidazoleglycerol-phosphate dehydratase
MVKIDRKTKETDIKCKLDINKSFDSKIDTKIGFFNHMLEAFAKHSNISLDLECIGDRFVDDHHSVEDCGIVIGQALNQDIFPINQIERYANATVVMDEACVEVALDLSNRPYLVYENKIFGKVGEFDVELVEEFFYALVINAKITCHIIVKRGTNKHHIIEAIFKAFAVALRRALVKNEALGVPSTKGVL